VLWLVVLDTEIVPANYDFTERSRREQDCSSVGWVFGVIFKELSASPDAISIIQVRRHAWRDTKLFWPGERLVV
jgi:hypothetical protein